MRRVQMRERIPGNAVARPDDEYSAVLQPVEAVVSHLDVFRPHVLVRVVEDNPVISELIVCGLSTIYAGVAAHYAVVKSVEVDAFSVDLFQFIELVRGAIHVAGSVDGGGEAGVFDVGDRIGKADAFGDVM